MLCNILNVRTVQHTKEMKLDFKQLSPLIPGGGGLMPGGGMPIGAPRPGGMPIGGPIGGLMPGGGPIMPVENTRP